MDKAIVKTRLGHYWTPGAGAMTALVVAVDRDNETVNLVAFDSDGDDHPHAGVPITGGLEADGKATFHLTSACPPDCPEFAR